MSFPGLLHREIARYIGLFSYLSVFICWECLKIKRPLGIERIWRDAFLKATVYMREISLFRRKKRGRVTFCKHEVAQNTRIFYSKVNYLLASLKNQNDYVRQLLWQKFSAHKRTTECGQNDEGDLTLDCDVRVNSNFFNRFNMRFFFFMSRSTLKGKQRYRL